MTRTSISLVLLFAVLGAPTAAHASRILEVCEIAGSRPNQLIGYGLVVGLNNTGDTGQARFTVQSTAAMLRRLGATIDPAALQARNAAAVVVTATLPAASSPGLRIDVQVSSLGNARSLAGGTLLQTPLYGGDRQVYAVAQGSLLVGGFGASGRSGSSLTRNHPTAGRVPEGAIVERRVRGGGVPESGPIALSLREPSFITAQRVVQAVDGALGAGTARALDSGTVEIQVPERFATDRVGLIATIQELEVEPESRARVVIDERTGTIVLGADVRIREAAIAQGGLTVEIREAAEAAQPPPLSNGTTQTVERTDVAAAQTPTMMRVIGPTASLADVVNALNSLGVQPRELVAIFQALRTAGALSAEIELQ